MTSKNIPYIRKLDHLRFFAAWLVGVYHYYHFQTPAYNGFKDPRVLTSKPFSAFLIEGHTGVALFLVLSGFIFAAICYRREVSYPGFVMNRVLRIFPLYGVAIFLATMLAGAPLAQFFGSLLLPYPGREMVSYVPITPHLWTIRLEFQFYLIFPFLILFAAKYGLRYLLGLILLALSIRCMIWVSPEHDKLKDAVYGTLVGRLDQFAIGMLAGSLYSGRADIRLPKWLGWRYLPLIAWLAPLGVVYLFHRLGGNSHLPPGHGFWVIYPDLEGLAWAFFTLAYVLAPWDWPERISKALGWLGALSFSLYINHWIFAHDLTWRRLEMPWGRMALPQLSESMTTNALLGFTFVALPLLVLFSAITYYVIEKPFFELRRSYLKKKPGEGGDDRDRNRAAAPPASPPSS
ncbi:peptidoglycan/LPS O-acetylase OafA/YrhL [Roseimicrobium gellanilyticum]|uniref:Peptidoglycan/LPS O-acetylase OafA/YrhL n=1 Tax=Roseimicrobium gellanilyticum TaxID=748857 RepID=A0A366H627_9BACT|nr:acyltransferase [Roseimicrobium gellanilyticum]RBP36673.1 peptidoglycan/LPS O-acetylase OafA/YrhL [Roseimicrobium gellanilyticum]